MTGNNSDMMKEMIELFLNQLIEAQVDMVLLADSENWFELSRMAHKIKSSALVMGVSQMADEMKELEMLAKEGRHSEKYTEYLVRFKEMVSLIEMELKQYLEQCK